MLEGQKNNSELTTNAPPRQKAVAHVTQQRQQHTRKAFSASARAASLAASNWLDSSASERSSSSTAASFASASSRSSEQSTWLSRYASTCCSSRLPDCERRSCTHGQRGKRIQSQRWPKLSSRLTSTDEQINASSMEKKHLNRSP